MKLSNRTKVREPLATVPQSTNAAMPLLPPGFEFSIAFCDGRGGANPDAGDEID